MIVSILLEQPCNKSDSLIKLVTSHKHLVPNMFQLLGTSSANTICQQFVNRLVTICLKSSYDLCIFTRVSLTSPKICNMRIYLTYQPTFTLPRATSHTSSSREPRVSPGDEYFTLVEESRPK